VEVEEEEVWVFSRVGVKAEPLEPMAPTEPSRAAPTEPIIELPVPVIDKEEEETDWYGAACGVGVFNPSENRTVPTGSFIF
jgi:hypothetical protein